MVTMSLFLRLGLLTALAMAPCATTAATVDVQVDEPGHRVSPTLWGIFFEDINLSADGGVYPELVRNRSFDASEQPEFWKAVGDNAASVELAIDDRQPLNPLNRTSLRVRSRDPWTVENEGYWGMNVAEGDGYTLNLAARPADGFSGPVTVRLVSEDGKTTLAEGKLTDLGRSNADGGGRRGRGGRGGRGGGEWRQHTLELSPKASDAKARLQISGEGGSGALLLDMVSLMPNKTWKKSGMRPDLCEMLDALKPSFFRFPGGCWVEGDDLAHMNKWKNTVGDVAARTPLYNIWGYMATHGLGYHEYLQLSEDLGAEPLFCINVGMSHKEAAPMAQMGQWVQDALDAIEYANGPVDSVWGGLRAANGHPEPFNLKYIEIGNENGGDLYRERWPLFVKAIKAKYPEMVLVANHWQGGYPTSPMPEVVDEHYYNTPDFFMQQANKYDSYDRNGPKIFVGEYAVTRNGGTGNLRAAIGEAAFMTGIERNSDIVTMACYAPLLVNVNHRRWNPDLINFDSSRAYGLPGYYVQQLFSLHRGDVTLPVKVDTTKIEEPAPTGCIGVGTWNTEAEFKDVKVTSPDGKVLFESDFAKGDDGWEKLGDGDWSIKDGALHQSAQREFVRALAGDRSWGDYDLALKARKIAGAEGFLILFHIQGNEDRTWWNIAGWNNTQHAVQLGGTQDPKRGAVEADRWYDIKVSVRGASVKCYLDGELVHDIKNTLATTSGMYASATRDDASGEVIVKVVNTLATPTKTDINLNGVDGVKMGARAIVLTSENATDENSLDDPLKVSPKDEELEIEGPTFTRELPGNSLTVFRIPVSD
jgi:alpha-L-arabinofuranosidase